MKLFCFIYFLFLVAANAAAGQDSLLVKIGLSGITVQEFEQRFEFIPQIISGAKRSFDKKKSDLLHSLIAEKLWAREAENLRVDTTDYMRITYKVIEKMYVRDALYRIEISDKVSVSGEESTEGLRRFYYNLNLDVIHSKDSSLAFRIYKMLGGGVSFDSAKSISNTDYYLVQFKYGELEESIEDILFNLNEGEFTYPIKSSAGWLIFKLHNKELASFSSQDQAIMNVQKIIQQRKTDRYYNEFYRKFFVGKKVETDAILFWSLADKISRQLSQKKITSSISDSDNVYLDVNDLLIIESELESDTLNMPFVKFENDPTTVKEFLREFIFEGFYSASTSPSIIAAKLNARVKSFIENELLAREGYKRGLQNLPDVKSSTSMWRDNYLARILKNMLYDSVKVTEQEVEEYYQNNDLLNDSSNVEVNILEILTDSLEVIESVIRELERGADFRQLASLHTKRIWTRSNGGEFGFFPITMYGDIGRIASQMNVGEIYGPIKLPEGYSIFKLIDKRIRERDSSLSIEETKDEMRKNLTLKKLKEFFIDYTVKLANKYGVEINEQMFASLQVQDMNMFVYRYMGFGGRITAVPMAIPFNEWYLPWKESKKQIP